MRVFQQIKDTFSILRNEDVDDEEKVAKVHHVKKWFPLHNNQYIIREEFAPFPLNGCCAVNTKQGFYLYGGVGRFNAYPDAKKMFCVREIDWADIEIKNFIQDENREDMLLATDIPKPRAYHTLTMVSETRAILYGGTLESAITAQYDPHLYDFDLTNVSKVSFIRLY
jgi:hypothetical protein